MIRRFVWWERAVGIRIKEKASHEPDVKHSYQLLGRPSKEGISFHLSEMVKSVLSITVTCTCMHAETIDGDPSASYP